jgi:DUF438 domain-containing protein
MRKEFTKEQRRAIYLKAAEMIFNEERRLVLMTIDELSNGLFFQDAFHEIKLFYHTLSRMEAEDKTNALLLCAEMCR